MIAVRLKELIWGTFGQTISPPPRFTGNDDDHNDFHDIDDL